MSKSNQLFMDTTTEQEEINHNELDYQKMFSDDEGYDEWLEKQDKDQDEYQEPVF